MSLLDYYGRLVTARPTERLEEQAPEIRFLRVVVQQQAVRFAEADVPHRLLRLE